MPKKRPTARDVQANPSLRRDRLSFGSAFGEPVTAPHVAHTWPLGWTVGSIGGDAVMLLPNLEGRPMRELFRTTLRKEPLNIAVFPILADPDENNCAEKNHDSHPSGRTRPFHQSEVVRTAGCSCPVPPE